MGGGDQANPGWPEPSAEDERFWSETVKFRADGCGCSYLYGNNVNNTYCKASIAYLKLLIKSFS